MKNNNLLLDNDIYYESLDSSEKGLFSKVFNIYNSINNSGNKDFLPFLNFLVKLSTNDQLANDFISGNEQIKEGVLSKVLDTLDDRRNEPEILKEAKLSIERKRKDEEKKKREKILNVENQKKVSELRRKINRRENNTIINNNVLEMIYLEFDISDEIGLNKGIIKEQLKLYKGDMLKKHSLLIDFLESKINKAKSKEDIKKIPKIISNIYDENIGKNNNSAKKEGNNFIMNLYKNRFKK